MKVAAAVLFAKSSLASRRLFSMSVVDKSHRVFICDLQERFRPAIDRFDSVIGKTRLLIRSANELDIPITVTEQNPRALGSTVEELKSVITAESTKTFAKKQFSMMIEEVSAQIIEDSKGKQLNIYLCGIEAHVCVLQTVLDIFRNHPSVVVHILCDTVSSQRPHDRAVALSRLQAEGAKLTTVESVLFQWLVTADHPKFKTISGLIKEHSGDKNDFAAYHTF